MTPEQKTTVETMWKAGMSAGVILRALGDGVTRNAIMGHVNRKHMMRNGGRSAEHLDSPGRPRIHPQRRSRKIRVLEIEEPESAEQVEPVAIWDLRRCHCRWLIGDPREPFEARYCGRTKLPERSYCREHYAISVGRLPTG